MPPKQLFASENDARLTASDIEELHAMDGVRDEFERDFSPLNNLPRQTGGGTG